MHLYNNYSLSCKTVNTRENFWNVYCFMTNQMREETAKDNRQTATWISHNSTQNKKLSSVMTEAESPLGNKTVCSLTTLAWSITFLLNLLQELICHLTKTIVKEGVFEPFGCNFTPIPDGLVDFSILRTNI